MHWMGGGGGWGSKWSERIAMSGLLLKRRRALMATCL